MNDAYSTAPAQGQWSSGICDCFSDCSSCCLTCWCPCITFGRIAEIVDQGESSCLGNACLYMLLELLFGFQWVYTCIIRSELKKQMGVEPNMCADGCAHFCCGRCALCQEYRELQNRGFVTSLGWKGNMERQNNHGINMVAPSASGGMMR